MDQFNTFLIPNNIKKNDASKASFCPEVTHVPGLWAQGRLGSSVTPGPAGPQRRASWEEPRIEGESRVERFLTFLRHIRVNLGFLGKEP